MHGLVGIANEFYFLHNILMHFKCVCMYILKEAICFPVFVGQTDSVQCHFELDDDCPWQLDGNVSVVRAGQSGTLYTDASSDSLGTQIDLVICRMFHFLFRY